MQLLLLGHPYVDLMDRGAREGDRSDAPRVFDRLRSLLAEAVIIDPEMPVSETKSGIRRLRVPNPHDEALGRPTRIRLWEVSPAAAFLHAFILLRVRYQPAGGSGPPEARIVARAASGEQLDALYLAGDAFSERYPVRPEIARSGDNVTLSLVGEPQLVWGGLGWPRGDYVRSRDVSLLSRPLNEALEGPARLLAIPRQVWGAPGTVRVRVPERALARVRSVRWIDDLHELASCSDGEKVETEGPAGEHWRHEASAGGFVVGRGPNSTQSVTPIRRLASQDRAGSLISTAGDARVPITFEGLGGAREIGANAYLYEFGPRALLVDAGFDATRDGWLGLPALERIARLDAVLLTHAHLDHVGSLPAVLAAFPGVPVYCTLPTLRVLPTILRDSAKIGELRREETGEVPAFSRAMVDAIRWNGCRILGYGKAEGIPEIPGLAIELGNAGHIIGSSYAMLEISGVRILHTGDISVEDQHLLRGMHVREISADHLIIEGTNGNEPGFTREKRRKAVGLFLEAVGERVDAGGSVLVPAFALGRAQELVGLLADWVQQTRRSVEIRTVGLVNVLNEICHQLPSFLPGLSSGGLTAVRALDVGRNKSREERAAEYARVFTEAAAAGPQIIIASHGMMMENTGSYFIGRAILTGSDPRHAIFLCGYMDPRTPGYRLKQHCEDPIIDFGAGDPVTRTIPHERIKFHRLTAHASYEELIEVATSVPRRTVTLVHGDAAGLDRLRGDLREKLNAVHKDVEVRAPDIGERILLDTVPAPDGLTDPPAPREGSDMLAPGRVFRHRGFGVRGLTQEGDRGVWWALIPVGGPEVVLALEHDRVDASRIRRVEVHPVTGPFRVVFDRAQGLGNISRIPWGRPGKAYWHIHCEDPTGRTFTSRMAVNYGVELQPVHCSLDAVSPLLEVVVGGTDRPRLVAICHGRDGKKLPFKGDEWDEDGRILRMTLDLHPRVTTFRNVRLVLRWPGGVKTEGPNIGSIALEPRMAFRPAPAYAGIPANMSLTVEPHPSRARFDGVGTLMTDSNVCVTPRRPGPATLEVAFTTAAGDLEWHEVGSIHVNPSVQVDAPLAIDIAEDLVITVREMNLSHVGRRCGLRVGAVLRAEWVASLEPFQWSGPLQETGSIELAVVVAEASVTLWTGTVLVREGIALDRAKSFLATSTTGDLEAELAWTGPAGWARAGVEKAFADAGFIILGWRGDVLRIAGSASTAGRRDIEVFDGPRTIRVPMTTIPDCCLCLEEGGRHAPGDVVTLRATGCALFEEGAPDTGPLAIEADRVFPLFDALSADVDGARIRLLHPGRYAIALVAGGRRLAEVEAEVRQAIPQVLPAATHTTRVTVRERSEASARIAALPPASVIADLVPAGGAHTILQSEPDAAIQSLREFVASRLKKEKVLVVTAGLSLPPAACRLMASLRRDMPRATIAHLSYPAPRGELAPDADAAREMRRYRVLCAAPARSLVDRGDSYVCAACGGSSDLETDGAGFRLVCRACNVTDSTMVFTLAALRSTDVDVLFADYRIARYLSRGRGARYAGAFGRSVRCGGCRRLQPAFARPEPWDRAELGRLLAACAEVWSGGGATVTRAARLATRRARTGRPEDVARHEDSIQRLMEAGALENGVAKGPIDRLEQGVSLCCAARLVWAPRRVAHVFLCLEVFRTTAPAVEAHPGLPRGEPGIRQVLALEGPR